jgi:hypothetical protein
MKPEERERNEVGGWGIYYAGTDTEVQNLRP